MLGPPDTFTVTLAFGSLIRLDGGLVWVKTRVPPQSAIFSVIFTQLAQDSYYQA